MDPSVYGIIHRLVYALVPDVQIDVRMLGAWLLIALGFYGMWHVERRHR